MIAALFGVAAVLVAVWLWFVLRRADRAVQRLSDFPTSNVRRVGSHDR